MCRRMKEKFSSLTRWWYLLPLLTAALALAGIYFYADWEGVSYICLGLSVLFLVFQIALLLVALGLRKWWNALGIFLLGVLSSAAVFLCLSALLLSEGMDKTYGQDAQTILSDIQKDTLDCVRESAVSDTASSPSSEEWTRE